MPVNIQVSDGNFSLGPQPGLFYTLNRSLDALLAVESDGDLAASFPVLRSLIRKDVVELHFDGTFFWTLEELPSTLGIVIKRWRLFPRPSPGAPSVTPAFFRWEDEITLINITNIKYFSKAFAVEHYHRTLGSSFAKGSSSIILNDASKIEIGDVLYLGPSTFAGFENMEESITVTGKSGNTIFFNKAGGLQLSYIANDPVDFVKSVIVFNDHSFSGSRDNRGTLLRFSWPAKTLILADQGHKYAFVNAADFDQTLVSFVRGDQIMQLDLDNPTFDLNASMEANLRESDLQTPITVFDLIADLNGNQYLKLQRKETTEDIPTGVLNTTTFPSNKFSFQTFPTLTFVNSTSLAFNTRQTQPFASGETIDIVARIRDQFNFPVLSKSVQFSATVDTGLGNPGTPGTFLPVIDITNASGIAQTIYTPSTTVDEIVVDIQAQVL